MPVKACYATPLLHAAEIERSLKFYQLLGFETVDTDRCQPFAWARMHSDGGAVMFVRGEQPVRFDSVRSSVYVEAESGGTSRTVAHERDRRSSRELSRLHAKR
ncbi:MAG TPA: hypothetical protein VFN20_10070 [Candidatus Acidoferrum sp.]|nr:hypothetical protein [Candidatus Acidoferrum sp.]